MTRMIAPAKIRGRSAFTLEEALLSLGILAVLILLLLGIIDGSMRLWHDGESRHEAIREAKRGIQMITRDLHSAVLSNSDGALVIQSTNPNDGSPISSQRLFFLISQPEELRKSDAKGDLCAAGYFIANDPQDDNSRNLYRFHASSDLVAEAIDHGRLRALYELASPTNRANAELVARNIVGLEVRGFPEKCPHPELLAIYLTAINGDTARLTSSDSGASERNIRFIRDHVQQFAAIVHLPPRRDTP